MSTFPRRPEELYEEVADHLGPEFAETRQSCRDTLVPSETVVGLVVDRAATEHPGVPLASAPDVRAADQAVAELAGALRAQVRLPSLNPGGWESAELAEPLPSTEPGPASCVTVL